MDNLVETFSRMSSQEIHEFAELAVQNGIGTYIEFALHSAQLEHAHDE